mgnify:CR=1 FL=1
MNKPMIDPDTLIEMFETATAKQGAQLRKAVGDATLAALQGRELSLKNIRSTLQAVSGAASMGAARNATAGTDPETLLDAAVSGMDDAMLKAVDANRAALQQFVTQGADMSDKHLKKAMDDLDKFEDTMFAAFKKTAAGAGAPMAGAWGQVLEKFQAAGTLSGAKAAGTGEQMSGQAADQMQAALRSTRASSLRAAQSMAESYTAMVSGVLLGMSEAMKAGAPAKKTTRK